MTHHLGSRVSALVDGQLPPEVAERALAHAATCPRCRDAVELERAARRAIGQAPEPEPSGDLTARLLALATSLPPPGRGLPAMVGPRAAPLRRRAGSWALLLSGTAAAAAVGGLYVLGGPAGPALEPEDLMAAVTPAGGPGGDAGGDGVSGDDAGGDGIPRGADITAAAMAWLRERGWVTPSVVPSDLAVVDLRATEGRVEVELAGPGGEVLLVERRGHLEPDDALGADRVRVGDVEGVVLATDPWTAAVQSGDVVVLVMCDGDRQAARAVVAAVPARQPDAGAAARIARGWETVAGSVTAVLPG
jgi:hypothetical protein